MNARDSKLINYYMVNIVDFKWVDNFHTYMYNVGLLSSIFEYNFACRMFCDNEQ